MVRTAERGEGCGTIKFADTERKKRGPPRKKKSGGKQERKKADPGRANRSGRTRAEKKSPSCKGETMEKRKKGRASLVKKEKGVFDTEQGGKRSSGPK